MHVSSLLLLCFRAFYGQTRSLASPRPLARQLPALRGFAPYRRHRLYRLPAHLERASIMSGGVAEPVNPALAPFTFPTTWKVSLLLVLKVSAISCS